MDSGCFLPSSPRQKAIYEQKESYMKDPDYKYVASLVVRAQQNDSSAFAELYALTYNKVYNYARHYLRDDFLAQDAMQEVYITALKNIQKIKDPSLFIAWINRISFHVCFDMMQKSGTRSETGDPEILELIRDEYLDSNPEARAEKSDEILRLRKAVESLPFHEREVITLRFFGNMKLEELAAALEISRSTVKRYLASGQEHLREMLKG